jgi:hypothetical protein
MSLQASCKVYYEPKELSLGGGGWGKGAGRKGGGEKVIFINIRKYVHVVRTH